MAPLTIESFVFCDNYARGNTVDRKKGGVLYLTGASGRAAVRSGTIRGNGTPSGDLGDVYLASGRLGLTNVLITSNESDGINAVGGTLDVVNCTLADNTGFGLTDGGATVSAKNCIAWENGAGGINAADSVTYSCSQETIAGEGNLDADPLFVNAATGDYHLQSEGGSWHNDVQQWEVDAESSLCINAGDRLSAHNLEPSPNGRRINMGRYGNTAYASKLGGAQGCIFLIR